MVIDVDPETWDIRDPELDFFVPETEYGVRFRDASGVRGSGIIQQQGAAKTEDELLREVELKFAVLQLLLGAQAQRGAPCRRQLSNFMDLFSSCYHFVI